MIEKELDFMFKDIDRLREHINNESHIRIFKKWMNEHIKRITLEK